MRLSQAGDAPPTVVIVLLTTPFVLIICTKSIQMHLFTKLNPPNLQRVFLSKVLIIVDALA
jgi:hypothetical protein